MTTDVKKIVLLAALLTAGLTLNILACVVGQNWFPILVVVTYVLAPLPQLIFSPPPGDTTSFFRSEEENSGFQDFGSFTTGVLVTTGLALPGVLLHSQLIKVEGFAMGLSGGLLVYGSLLMYMRWFLRPPGDDSGGYSFLG